MMKRKICLSACLLCCLFACPKLFASDYVTGLANVVYVQEASLNAGSEAVLTAMIKNDIQAVGFQFDLCLPEGVTLSGEPVSAIASGSVVNAKQHIMRAVVRKDGSCRVLCFSFQNSSLVSPNGSAATIHVKVDSELPAGSYPVVLKNVEITKADGQTVKRLEAVETTLTVNGITMFGDVNKDGRVDVADILTVISFIASGHGNANPNVSFNPNINADVNGDGKVDAADITAIITAMSTKPGNKRANEMLNPKH